MKTSEAGSSKRAEKAGEKLAGFKNKLSIKNKAFLHLQMQFATIRILANYFIIVNK